MADVFNDLELELIAHLVENGRWYPRYLDSRRRGPNWFSERTVAYHRVAAGAAYSVDGIRGPCLATIQYVTAQVVMKVDAIVAATPGANRRRRLERIRDKKRLAQIIYGVFGNRTDLFLDPGGGHGHLLDYIVRRRFRAVDTMTRAVNSFGKSRRSAFDYPNSLLESKVNDAASTLWEGITEEAVPGGPKRYPFKLTAAGKAQPVDAIEKLFTTYDSSEAQKRSKTPCDPAACAVHLRALLAGANPGQIAAHAAGQGDDYLVIDHPFGPVRNQGDAKNPRIQGSAYAHTLEEIQVSGPGPAANVEIAVDWPWWLDLQLSAAGNPGWQPVNTPVRIISGDHAEEITVSHLQVGSDKSFTGRIRIASVDRAYPIHSRLSPSNVPIRHVLTDSRPGMQLFEQRHVSTHSLQVGDHVYVANHPVYRALEPEGFWVGEHSFITDIFQGQGTGVLEVRVQGHGVDNLAVKELVSNEMLGVANQGLRVAQYYLEAALQVVPDVNAFVPIDDKPDWKRELNRISGGQPFNGVIAVLGVGPAVGRRQVAFLQGTLGQTPVSAVSKDLILIGYKNHAFAINRALSGGLEPQHDYVIWYWDTLRGRQSYFPLYWRPGQGKTAWSPRKALYEDIEDVTLLGAGGNAFVVRPHIDGSAPYRQFLVGIGAIPASPGG